MFAEIEDRLAKKYGPGWQKLRGTDMEYLRSAIQVMGDAFVNHAARIEALHDKSDIIKSALSAIFGETDIMELKAITERLKAGVAILAANHASTTDDLTSSKSDLSALADTVDAINAADAKAKAEADAAAQAASDAAKTAADTEGSTTGTTTITAGTAGLE